jgi:serpin B
MRRFTQWVRDLVGGKQPPDVGANPRAWAAYPFTETANEFALAMFGALAGQPGNLFFSPFSLRTVLGMALAGARGETAAQIAKALRASSEGEKLHAALGGVVRLLDTARGGGCEVAVANSLWGQDGSPLEAEFLDLMARHYGGGLNLVDFRRDPEGARARINEWVEERTRRRIRGLIPARGVGTDTRMVLANAVHFKGMWMNPFSKTGTHDEPFRLESGATVPAPLMHECADVWYAGGDGFHAVDLPYEGDSLSMFVLLPYRPGGLLDLEKKLSAQMIQECAGRMTLREVKLFFPRFRIEGATIDVAAPLAALGVTLPFSRTQADFSGINGRRPPDDDALYFSAVFHQALVEVNEEGTEAAAATAASMTLGVMPAPAEGPAPVFRADHPFLFAIRHRRSGEILFVGRMADPTRPD